MPTSFKTRKRGTARQIGKKFPVLEKKKLPRIAIKITEKNSEKCRQWNCPIKSCNAGPFTSLQLREHVSIFHPTRCYVCGETLRSHIGKCVLPKGIDKLNSLPSGCKGGKVKKRKKKIEDMTEKELLRAIREENLKQNIASIVRARKMKDKGFTHRIVGWIHPGRGDDYQIEAFIKGEPDRETIRQLLRKSAIKTDYKVERL